jgi:hypothetical protein
MKWLKGVTAKAKRAWAWIQRQEPDGYRWLGVIAVLLLCMGQADARCSSTSAASLSPRAQSLWGQIKRAFPDAVIVSARRCGARIAGTGQPSYHASGNAIDWKTRRFAAGVAWSRKHAPGLTMTYPGMSHIHSDVGRWKAYAHGYGGRRSRYASRRSHRTVSQTNIFHQYFSAVPR